MKKFLIPLIVLFLSSCSDTPKITKNDLVKKCVITSMTEKQPISVMDIEPMYIFTTECGTKFTSKRNDVYHIGDTVTYVYKDYYLKQKNPLN